MVPLQEGTAVGETQAECMQKCENKRQANLRTCQGKEGKERDDCLSWVTRENDACVKKCNEMPSEREKKIYDCKEGCEADWNDDNKECRKEKDTKKRIKCFDDAKSKFDKCLKGCLNVDR
jgi:hypothetical protein